jgi:hypothetical protein
MSGLRRTGENRTRLPAIAITNAVFVAFDVRIEVEDVDKERPAFLVLYKGQNLALDEPP